MMLSVLFSFCFGAIAFNSCTFSMNNGPQQAISVSGTGEVSITDSIFVKNTIQDSVVHIHENVTALFENSSFADNSGVDIWVDNDLYQFDSLCLKKSINSQIPAVMHNDEALILDPRFYSCEGGVPSFEWTGSFTPDSLVPAPRKHSIIKVGLFLFLLLEVSERIH